MQVHAHTDLLTPTPTHYEQIRGTLTFEDVETQIRNLLLKPISDLKRTGEQQGKEMEGNCRKERTRNWRRGITEQGNKETAMVKQGAQGKEGIAKGL